mgnify:CR=1 FL=1
MQFRLKTSKKTEEIFNMISQREHLQPFALSKIAIALAIRDNYMASNDESNIDSNGLELNRQTITSDNDLLFKVLIELNEKRYIEEDDYFPGIVKQYLDYGASLLEQEYKYGRNIYTHLVNLEKSI